ncbi:MAG: restriction endonuclease [Phycisphaerae bacterium]|nr:restriction endonuclease [Phycisphaerae bacterium]
MINNVLYKRLVDSDFLLPETLTEDATSLFSELPSISENLFHPLKQAGTGGKNYKEKRWEAKQHEFDFDKNTERKASFIEKVDGYRKSFQRVRDDSTLTSVTRLSPWDMLLPMLQPPVNFDFIDVLDLPPRCSPYPYQWDGIKFLVESNGALLGDDMGTGKTVQSILAMRLLFQRGDVKSALIVCPLSVLTHWDREMERWSPNLHVTVVRGNKVHREYCWYYTTHVWITTYDTLRQDMKRNEDDLKNKFDLVILDETQRIKNPDTGITKAVRKLDASYRWGLSGTPIENKLDELVAIYTFLRPGLLKYAGLTPVVAKTAIQPFFLRRRKADVLKDLPEKHEFPVYLRFEDMQMRTYKQMEQEHVLHLLEKGETVTAGNILTLITELKKICNRDRITGESAKLTWLRENLEDVIAEGDKVLVFTQYRQKDFGGADWLENELSEYGTLNYGQATSDSKRQGLLHTFSTDKTKKVFIGHPRTAGVGLNELVVANYVIHFDHWWNPAAANQATDRAHRPGQNKEVFVYHLWVEDTIEEMIQRKLEEKQLLYDTVIDSLSSEVKDGMLFDIYDDLLAKYGIHSTRTEKGKMTGAKLSTLEGEKTRPSYGTPGDFEILVAMLFEKMGYHTRVTPASNDRGVDVIAVKEAGLSCEKIAVQCKLVNSPVGRPVLQQLLGVLSENPTYSRGCIVTNNRMSREAVAYLKENGRLAAIEGHDLENLLHKFGLEGLLTID